ncbi:Uncharacterised protein [uncultured archaeon]|nr:Uncharacterised protein [uncultured archaeon]
MEGEEEKDSTAASEIRYIALELMKLAQQSKRSFAEVADEYLDNTEKLSRMIAGEEEPKSSKKAASSRQK